MSAERSPITTTIDFEQDGKQRDYLRVPHSRNSSAWGSVLIPMTVIKNGTGPTVLFIGGNHGGEYEGPVSLIKLSRELKLEKVQGRVMIIPALNLPAVVAGQRVSPLDGNDMNRVFPGAWNGTITQVIAHYVHEALLPLCDAVIDLHAGGYSLSLVPFMSMHYLENQTQSQQTFAAMQAFQAPVSLVTEEISGEGLLDYAVERMGKIFLCAELGSAGTLSPQVIKITDVGVRNLLVHFGIIEGEVVTRESQGLSPSRLMEVPEPENYHMALADGIYESFYELGAWVEAGDPLGQIHFIENIAREPQLIIAQRSGMLLCTRGPGFVEIGDCVAVVARDLDSPANERSQK
ncbi:MAG: succinylglutamate desuccinylase/aspartoacylase family protein [Anaerolineae bacterium]